MQPDTRKHMELPAQWWRVAPLVVWMVLAILLFRNISLASGGQPPESAATARTGVPVPAQVMRQRLPDLDGKPQTLSQWPGKVLVINFWATWCPPCRRETPDFVQAQKTYRKQGLQLVGIALDSARSVRPFARQYGINYPLLVGEQSGIPLAQALGDDAGILPYTVVIDRKGNMVGRAAGLMDPDKFNQVIRPLLDQKP